MTNKRLDRKFMSCVWGLVRLLPFFVILVQLLIFVGYSFNESYFIDFTVGDLDLYLVEFFDSYNDYFLNYIESFNVIIPNFMSDVIFDNMEFIENYFAHPTSLIGWFIFINVFYQLWISLLQILFNVLMIIPNIANYFIEKFVHLGNKGDY